MNKEIIYSFKEYQEKYILALDNFCKNKEFEEIDFISTEIDSYKVYLTSVSIYKRIRYRMPNDLFLDEDATFLSENCVSYDLIVEVILNRIMMEGINKLDNVIAEYKIHFRKIISFLEDKKTKFSKSIISSENIPEIDLSTSSAVQKIIYLNELGIIDLLIKEPCFVSSVNNLTNVITAITGEKHTTLQPYLNVLINNTGNENNNPYKTTSTVNKVKNQLINLGIKPK